MTREELKSQKEKVERRESLIKQIDTFKNICECLLSPDIKKELVMTSPTSGKIIRLELPCIDSLVKWANERLHELRDKLDKL